MPCAMRCVISRSSSIARRSSRSKSSRPFDRRQALADGATTMTTPQPSDTQYDYVIIGAGSAGCVLASRLTERTTNRVLLIEAGKDYAPGHEPPEILDIFAATAYANPRF